MDIAGNAFYFRMVNNLVLDSNWSLAFKHRFMDGYNGMGFKMFGNG